jgi:carbohydrate diacid regulator
MEMEGVIAEKIIERTKDLIPYDINVMDKKGIVVASTSAERIGLMHDGASLVIQSRQPVTIHAEATPYLAGVKPGLNLPIEYQGELIGVVGITGDPTEVCNLGSLLKITAELLFEQSREQDAVLLQRIEKENCIKEILNADIDTPTAVDKLKEFNIKIRFPAMCVTIQPERKVDVNIRKLELMSPLDMLLNGLFFFSPDTGLTVILEQASNTEEKINKITELFNAPLKIGIGCQVTSYSKLTVSRDTADAAIQYGTSLKGKNGISFFYYDEYKEKIIISSLAHGWHFDELTKEYRALVEQDHSGTLRLTLHTLMSSSGDMVSCARMLDIHRNTLRYRLDKIHDITGVNYKKMDELFRLYLGKVIID